MDDNLDARVFDWQEQLDKAKKYIHLKTKDHKPFKKLSLVLWGVALGMTLILEAIGLRDEADSWPPLTHVIIAYVPEGLTASFIGWAATHFKEAYGD